MCFFRSLPLRLGTLPPPPTAWAAPSRSLAKRAKGGEGEEGRRGRGGKGLGPWLEGRVLQLQWGMGETLQTPVGARPTSGGSQKETNLKWGKNDLARLFWCLFLKGLIGGPLKIFSQPWKYHTKGCSRSSVDSPGARTLVFAAFELFSRCKCQVSIARTPFCAILWRSPKYRWSLQLLAFSQKTKQSIWETQIFAENRWFSQKTAGTRIQTPDWRLSP